MIRFFFFLLIPLFLNFSSKANTFGIYLMNMDCVQIEQSVKQKYISSENPEDVERASKQIMQQFENYTQLKSPSWDEFDDAIAKRARDYLEREIENMKTSLDKRKAFVSRNERFENWIEALLAQIAAISPA